MGFDMNSEDEDPHGECRSEIERLEEELESTADKLSDCWLLLDAMARSEFYLAPRTAAVELLRKQQAPGWTERGKTE